LGAGISSYHQQLVHLFFLVTALFLLNVPTLAIYSQYSFYQSRETESAAGSSSHSSEQGLSSSASPIGSGLLTFSLGNLGFSEPICSISLMKSNQEDGFSTFQCSHGSQIGGLSDFGVLTMFENQKACVRSSETGTQYCNQYFHDQLFREHFISECIGKQSCAIAQVSDFFDATVAKDRIEICHNH